MKKVLWTAMLSVGTALGAALGARTVSFIWRKAAHEDPPEVPRWARLLVSKPVKKKVGKSLPAPTV